MCAADAVQSAVGGLGTRFPRGDAACPDAPYTAHTPTDLQAAAGSERSSAADGDTAGQPTQAHSWGAAAGARPTPDPTSEAGGFGAGVAFWGENGGGDDWLAADGGGAGLANSQTDPHTAAQSTAHGASVGQPGTPGRFAASAAASPTWVGASSAAAGAHMPPQLYHPAEPYGAANGAAVAPFAATRPTAGAWGGGGGAYRYPPSTPVSPEGGSSAAAVPFLAPSWRASASFEPDFPTARGSGEGWGDSGGDLDVLEAGGAGGGSFRPPPPPPVPLLDTTRLRDAHSNAAAAASPLAAGASNAFAAFMPRCVSQPPASLAPPGTPTAASQGQGQGLRLTVGNTGSLRLPVNRGFGAPPAFGEAATPRGFSGVALSPRGHSAATNSLPLPYGAVQQRAHPSPRAAWHASAATTGPAERLATPLPKAAGLERPRSADTEPLPGALSPPRMPLSAARPHSAGATPTAQNPNDPYPYPDPGSSGLDFQALAAQFTAEGTGADLLSRRLSQRLSSPFDEAVASSAPIAQRLSQQLSQQLFGPGAHPAMSCTLLATHIAISPPWNQAQLLAIVCMSVTISDMIVTS